MNIDPELTCTLKADKVDLECTLDAFRAILSKTHVLSGAGASIELSFDGVSVAKELGRRITAIHPQAPETKPEPKTALSTREFLSILADKDAEIEVLAQTAIFAGGTDINNCNTARANYSMALSERAEFIGSFELVAKDAK